MKNIKTLGLVTVIALSFLGWKKIERPLIPTPTPTVSASINGSQWTASSATATLTIDSTMPGRKFQLNTGSSEQIIKLQWMDDAVSPNLSSGNHIFNATDLNPKTDFIYTLMDSVGNTFTEQVPVSVSFHITSVDNSNHKVSGTFNSVSYKYETTDTLTITNGFFTNVPFSVVYE